MKAFIFPGQGSQRKGMGEDLFAKYPEYIKQADNILGYSVEALCRTDADNQLNFTAYTQPAIFIVSVLNYLEALNTIGPPDIATGHSIGEYAALFAAQVFDFETGLRIVQKRAELMAQAQGGGLAAVLGLSLDEVQDRIVASALTGVEIANINSPTQIVIGAATETIQDFVKFSEGQSGRIIPLRVSGAFHTSHMQNAQMEFSEFLAGISFQTPQIPVISNYTADAHTQQSLAENLAMHLTHPVRWTTCIATMVQAGVESFTEIGSKILTPMVRDICEQIAPQVFSTTTENVVQSKVQNAATAHTDEVDFCSRFGFKKPLIVGGTGYGASGFALVSSLCRQGVLSFLDTEYVSLADIESSLKLLSNDADLSARYGVSLIYKPGNSDFEEKLISLCLDYGVRFLELRGYYEPTPDMIRYRLKGGLDENNRPNNRILIRTSELEMVTTFIDSSVDVAKSEVSAESAPSQGMSLVDAICVELQPWRSATPNDLSTFQTILNQCREHAKQQPAFGKIFVGLSGLPVTQKPVESAMAQGADFALISSPFLLTKEANLDESIKIAMSNALEQQFKETFDWTFPACQTTSLSYVRDEHVLKQSILLKELYLNDSLTASAIREHETMSLSEGNTLLSERFLDACEGMNKFEIRAAIRERVQALSFPHIINCNASFPEFSHWLSEHGASTTVGAAKLAELIYSQNHCY